MPQIELVIVTYRDAFQWSAKLKGNIGSKYEECSAIIRLSESDLNNLGIIDGAEIKLSSAAGSVIVRSQLDIECRQGYGFMPVSHYSNKLVSYDETKAKLPNFKRIEAQAEPIDGM